MSCRIQITDHGIARLLERAFKLTRDEIVRQCVPLHVQETVHIAGGSCTVACNGVQMVFENYHLITVLDEGMDDRTDRRLNSVRKVTESKGKHRRARQSEKFKQTKRGNHDTD